MYSTRPETFDSEGLSLVGLALREVKPDEAPGDVPAWSALVRP
jgi:hypothetical protein